MTKTISPLRQRMLDDMKFRNMSPSTQKVYAHAVANFARFHASPPTSSTSSTRTRRIIHCRSVEGSP